MKYQQPNYLEPYNEKFQLNDSGKKLNDIGIQAIKEKGVCVIILAGGQGTRLGTTDPKGCYILPQINVSIFEIHCETIKKAQKICDCEIKLFLMTSKHTHSSTVRFFQNNNNFGLKKENVLYFQQDDEICLDFNDNPIMFKDGFATAPNGNGAIFEIMHKNDVYSYIENVKYCNVISVDNVLARVADPIVIGYMETNDFEICSKSVTKKEEENVGVFLLNEDFMVIREYNEIENLKEIESKFGKNIKIQGNICNHTFTVEFMKNIGKKNLPIHKACKKIPFTDENKNEIKPLENNGYKKEKFIFDCFKFTKKNGLVSVPRELEFAPVKNGIDRNVDNPQTAVENLFSRKKITEKNQN